MKKYGKTKDIIADKSTSGFKHPQLFEVNLFRMGAEGGGGAGKSRSASTNQGLDSRSPPKLRCIPIAERTIGLL